MKKDGCAKSLFLIFILFIFFMLIYVYVGGSFAQQQNACYGQEEYTSNINADLIPSDQLVVLQGNSLPNQPPEKIEFDQNDLAAQSVDGTPDGPKSMFVFAYNKCDPTCCMDSPYSCNGGCVCITEKQKQYFANRVCGK